MVHFKLILIEIIPTSRQLFCVNIQNINTVWLTGITTRHGLMLRLYCHGNINVINFWFLIFIRHIYIFISSYLNIHNTLTINDLASSKYILHVQHTRISGFSAFEDILYLELHYMLALNCCYNIRSPSACIHPPT